MSLALSSKKGVLFEDIQMATKIAVYLGDFSEFLGGVSRKEQNAAANAYMKANPLKTNNNAKALELVGKLETEYKNETKAASLKTRLRHRFGEKRSAEIVKLTALGAACAVGGVLAANGMGAASVPVLFAGLVATADNREMSDKAKADVETYGNAKRALFALKKMKKALMPESEYKKDVQSLYASGLGNPGGMITALHLKQKGGR